MGQTSAVIAARDQRVLPTATVMAVDKSILLYATPTVTAVDTAVVLYVNPTVRAAIPQCYYVPTLQ